MLQVLFLNEIISLRFQSKIVGFLYEKPDMYDVELTRKLVDVSRIMAIPLLDHIIVGAVDSVGGKGFVSMRENGAVEF